MNSKGNDALLKTSQVTEWTLNRGGYLPVVFGGLIIAGCLSAYVIAVGRGNVDAFLPLISDAAGSPPQNGLFGTLISLGGMTGVAFTLLRYMIVLEKNQEKSKLVTALNKLSLFVGIVSMCGITLVTGYPMNFYRNREIWLRDVGLPHMIGGVMLFSFGLVYIAMQCVLTLFLSSKDRNLFVTRVFICMVCTATFVYHMVTAPDNFGGISHYYYDNRTEDAQNGKQIPYPETMGSSLRLPIDTTGSYVTSAINEWILLFFFCGFFFTFYKETQEYSLMLVVETQMTESESLNDVSSDPNANSKPSVQPSGERRQSDVRTYFRRDSTCQTVPETDEEVSGMPDISAFQNGRYTKRQISLFAVPSEDHKLDVLEEIAEKKSKSNGEIIEEGKTVVNGGTELLSNGVAEVTANGVCLNNAPEGKTMKDSSTEADDSKKLEELSSDEKIKANTVNGVNTDTKAAEIQTDDKST